MHNQNNTCTKYVIVLRHGETVVLVLLPPLPLVLLIILLCSINCFLLLISPEQRIFHSPHCAGLTRLYNQQSMDGDGVSTLCGAVSTKGNTLWVVGFVYEYV